MKVKTCVGCGYCCMKTPCDVARRLYKGVTECPQLTWDEQKERYICGLMTRPEPMGRQYRAELYAGAGCCSGLNSWRQDVKKRTGIEGMYVNPIPQVMQMFIRALSCQFISGDVISLTLGQMSSEMIKSGYDKAEVDNIMKGIVNTFTQNRSSFSEEFMG